VLKRVYRESFDLPGFRSGKVSSASPIVGCRSHIDIQIACLANDIYVLVVTGALGFNGVSLPGAGVSSWPEPVYGDWIGIEGNGLCQ